MTWLLLALCCAAFVETAFRLGLDGQVRAATLVARKIFSVIGSARVSDHWKEKALPRYAGRLLSASARLFLIMLAAVAPIMLVAALSGWRGSPLLQLISSWEGLVAATLIAILYVAARSRLVRK